MKATYETAYGMSIPTAPNLIRIGCRAAQPQHHHLRGSAVIPPTGGS
jgi:hypothetical protein